MFFSFLDNVKHNLFKPLLLFFYMGFLVPILGVEFEFPHVIYQGLTIYLLISIGWKGGEELAELRADELGQTLGFMGTGFFTNFVIGILAFLMLRAFTKLRRIDAATIAGYYGSDSAGTFVTCVGVLTSLMVTNKIYDYAPYMPVMLAVMEIPGCLVALFLVSRLRRSGMDALGNMPDEEGFDPKAKRPIKPTSRHDHDHTSTEEMEDLALLDESVGQRKPPGLLSPEMLHEVFLNPGLYLLFGGILIGYISRIQGKAVTQGDDDVFIKLFQGLLCLFLLEMGMTASRKLPDLKRGGWQFIVFGLMAPILFATIGISVAHLFSYVTHEPLTLGTYVLFSVLCGAASYIAVPAVQRLAIPEASPTLPLAASLGLTFSFNVTIGIPLYIEVAKALMKAFPAA